ncbi:MAG: mechanosensitive ion channel family protein, partial [Myxococcales bacterium]|nr:mechanosensitive ion channel family protein [Myxococcales bacterium]
MITRLPALLATLLLLAPTLARAEGDAPADAVLEAGPCASPRAAAATFLDNLQPDQYLPRKAIECFARPRGMTDDQLIARAKDLKAVLDARGLYVVMDDLSPKNDVLDERGRLRSDLVDGADGVELRRIDGRWVFPATVVDRVPVLYRETFSGFSEAVLARLPGALRATVFGYEIWQFAGLLLLLALSFLVSRFVGLLVRNRLTALTRRWRLDVDPALLRAFAWPLGTVIAALFFLVLLPELRFTIGTARVLAIAGRVVTAIAGVLLAYRLVDLLALWMQSRALATENKLDDQLVVLVRKALRVVVVAVALIFVLQNLNVDVTSLLAGLSIGGLAFALAAKDTAANLFGAMTIFLDTPFYVGDWIKADGVEGTVEEIGLRSTRVRTFYNSILVVPNSLLTNATIDNMSRREFRRMTTRFGIGYHTTAAQMEAFVEGVRAIIAAHPDTRKDYYEVHFNEFGESALEVLLYAFIKVDSWSAELQAKHQIFLAIKQLAERLGVEFAFPTRTLHVDSVFQDAPRVVGGSKPPS